MKSELMKDKSYIEFLSDLKKKISLAQIKAVLAVNAQIVFLYWEIGNSILRKQEDEGWGTKAIERLSQDLRNAFPEIKGLSSRNPKYMRKFAETYPDVEFMQQRAAQIPWFHNCILIDKVKSKKEREWYIQQTIQNGWSRNVLVHQIETNLYDRKRHLTHNFDVTLPKPQSDLAKETLKDPYIFDFLTMGEEAHERDLEKQLVMDITKFLLELGAGFSFVGRQYNLEVGGQDYFIDLLFYHLKLRCFVAIELKIGEFKPEYALRDMSKPIGVSEYKLTDAIPEELKSSLPTIEELEAELTVNLKNDK